MKKNSQRNTPLLVESLVVGGIAIALEATSLVGLTYWSLTRNQAAQKNHLNKQY
ncbi:hypothetical protein [Fructilactobacillus lindneri]|uniref:Uncharacterized protein n=1 Tax=Fructilactobacillus lindneri DSM 20690 = JCM 11027 TaxID=1122148 RepID=A0A0R2JTI4_9LACO|nr:hypothetical protein [Fructilactobacillus lindneri]KRN79126.1 hypothetical protein IV52_GL000531 [Fructilactobacillus lindneri DSM 20690 = JCM 11027]SJZ74738.1 hypothetical protein SAMN02746042_00256 [Fructilactobacillus lindneri DSM 20690 = JCM 11027]